MRVLISAYACEPEAGSEEGAGWEWARSAALRHDVWVITRENNAPAIQKALLKEPHLRLHPVYVDMPLWARGWKKGPLAVYPYYLAWQMLAARTARQLHKRHAFDVLHHVTFASDSLPAGIAAVRGVPLVWGPVGGSSPTPWRLIKWLGSRGVIGELARTVVTTCLRQVFGDWTARRASVVLAQNQDVAERFNFARTVIEPNVAIPSGLRDETLRSERVGSGHGKTAVFVGRLVAWKGIRLAIATLAQPAAAAWNLDIYGTGPEAGAARRLADRLHLNHRVAFKGHRARHEVMTAMRSADALLFPSLHDSAPWSVGEAVTLGCPVVALDAGGPPVLVGPGEGVIVPIDRQALQNLGSALASCTRPLPGSSRWTPDRLPARLDDIYHVAAGQAVESSRTDVIAVASPSNTIPGPEPCD